MTNELASYTCLSLHQLTIYLTLILNILKTVDIVNSFQNATTLAPRIVKTFIFCPRRCFTIFPNAPHTSNNPFDQCERCQYRSQYFKSHSMMIITNHYLISLSNLTSNHSNFTQSYNCILLWLSTDVSTYSIHILLLLNKCAKSKQKHLQISLASQQD